MRRFVNDPRAAAAATDAVIGDLVAGWGNDWSAQREFLHACLEEAWVAKGPILECGSGLSTLLLGVVAQRRGLAHRVLEHAPEWAARVERELRRYGLGSTQLDVGPLKDYGDFGWYDPQRASLPATFALVVCDGPPGDTKGGRYGLVPVLGERLAPGCVILLDDAGRTQELAIARRWESELGGTLEVLGAIRPHARITASSR